MVPASELLEIRESSAGERTLLYSWHKLVSSEASYKGTLVMLVLQILPSQRIKWRATAPSKNRKKLKINTVVEFKITNFALL